MHGEDGSVLGRGRELCLNDKEIFNMYNTFYRVSGVDQNEGAKIAFVWCRAEGQEGLTLVGSGHIVDAEGDLPPGIRAGQFAVSFLLPPGCSADSITVTDNRNSKEFLPDVTVVRC
jgi:hypothetical protein